LSGQSVISTAWIPGLSGQSGNGFRLSPELLRSHAESMHHGCKRIPLLEAILAKYR